MIRAANLTRKFKQLTAVDNLNLEVARGEVFGLIGPDGAGKSTTLRLLTGLLDPTAGEAWVAGHHVVSQTQQVKDRIGYMAQRFGLYADLSVQENMEFYADLFDITGAAREELMPRLLAMTRMEPFRQRLAGRLSGGMKQKLALMCTLLHRPEVLFLDEPTNGVDPVSRRDFWLILQQLVAEGITVLVTTAYLDEAERCDRVGFLYQGRLIRCEKPSALKAEFTDGFYRVESASQRRVREALQSADGVVSVEPSGSELHLYLDASRTSVFMLEQYLKAAGVGPATFSPMVPSLEDVFIAMIGKAAQ